MSAFGSKLRKVEGGGLMFWCPGCDGGHMVMVGDGPGPRWGWNGSGDAPTFTPSIFVNAPGPYHTDHAHSCHSFVTDGRIQYLGDCTHALAGQTVELPDWEGF
ncbi:DUF6527 family protein [Frigidibacter sp. MR17.14]|uniref:DUF6527 family protein n=1 Tax=Frigidibacter sp. MR17.14 TaxID=3126509 RepID=UPI003013121E